MIGGNLIASAFGTFFGNPLTFPFIWLASYNFGSFLLGREQKSEINIGLPDGFWGNMLTSPAVAWSQFWDSVGPVIVPMLIGGLPLGFTIAVIAYFPVKAAVATFQQRRKDRLFMRAKSNSQDATVGN